MRLLLTQHTPILSESQGRYAEDLAAALRAAGHDARVLLADVAAAQDEPLVRRVRCGSAAGAEVPFGPPDFKPADAESPAFEAISEDQLTLYRDALRRALDAEVAAFDPHVIHCQHVWVQAQLSLETGVPYVITAWGPELDACQADERYCWIAEQAAENASRIFAADEPLRQRVLGAFEGIRKRTLLTPAIQDPATAVAELIPLYEDVLRNRFNE
jgi:hypothetical protein